MDVEKLPKDSSLSRPLVGSVAYNETSSNVTNSKGSDEIPMCSHVELSKKNFSYSHSKPSCQFIEGLRAIELVDPKCYRTPLGFQKEATFPCQRLLTKKPTPNIEGTDAHNDMSSHPQKESPEKCGRHGPLEKFTLMVGNNILHFKIVRAVARPNLSAESRSLLSAYKCSLCGKMLQSRSALEMHISDAHSSLKDYRCDTCNARFTSKISLISHMHCHTGPRPYMCTVCSKSFCRSNSLDLHMKMHITGHRHFCQICGRWFKSLASLAEHENMCIAVLNGDFMNCDRPFRWQCSFCEKMFHHRRDKNIHERVHTGEKPYSCGYCGRGFTQSQTLTIHIRTHTGEKPYLCGICGQEFRDSSALRKHEYRHAALPSSLGQPLYEDSSINVEIANNDSRLWNTGDVSS